MRPTVFQRAELRDENNNIIQQGTYGKGSALSNSTNDGWVDYVMNNLEALYDIAKDEVVPVSALPASGDMNKTYLLTTTGVCYRWDGAAWVEISSSEAVGRAETAANLAEQWATKTSGTVADNEYSAKYYANSAQQSADDAQDVADDMATHLSQIDENTTDIGIADKRISNIEKLLQGNLYDYDTDDDTAYTKTVPSGAMPYAGFEKVGGKTIAYNQKNNNLGETETISGVTFTNNGDGSWSLSGTAEADIRKYVNSVNSFVIIQYHKYLLFGCPHGGSVTTYGFSVDNFFTDTGGGIIATQNMSGGYRGISIFVKSGTDVTGLVFYPKVIDLTQMLGMGNEPTTVAECKEFLPANLYPFNLGTMMSAGVTEVVSKQNLAVYSGGAGEPSDTTLSNATKRVFPIGKYIVGIAKNNYYNVDYASIISVTNNSIAFSQNANGYGVGIPFNCVSGVSYDVSMEQGEDISVSWYASDGTYLSNTQITGSSAVVTAPNNAVQGVLVLMTATRLVEITYTDLKVLNELATISIPTAIRNLEGYGWSAGSAYNYIDFERKVFVQNVDKMVLDGTEGGWYSSGGSIDGQSVVYMSRNFEADGKKPFTQNLFIDKEYVLVDSFNKIGRYFIGGGAEANKNNIIFEVYNITPNWVAWLANNPLTLYYELATPIETDISEYLTDDNLIQVESGGTLTFPNSNGDDYRIPVPSEETYMIDLQEALS